MNETIRDIFKKHSLPRKLVLLTDLTIMALGFIFADILRFNLSVGMISLAEIMIHLSCIFTPIYLLAFLLTGSYRGILRHSSIEDFFKLFLAISLATVLIMLVSGITHLKAVPEIWMLPYSVVLIHAVVTLAMLLAFRLGVRGIYQTYNNPREGYSQVLIFGAGDLGQIAFNVLDGDGHSHVKVTGFIDDKKVLEGKELSGKQIYTEKQAFKRFIATGEINEIILAIDKKKISAERKKAFLEHCVQYGVKVKEVPPIKDWIGGKFSSRQIRDINIEDLLGRDPIWLNQDEVSKGLKNAVVLVTGAAGSIGSEIVRQLMSFESKKVILLDLAESPLFELQNELLKSWPASRFEVVIANVIDRYRMREVFEANRPEYVFHAAAYKHVPMMEDSPYQAVRVNIGGTSLAADLSVEFGVKKFVMISTDKAVNPTNVMGASKRICEIYIQSLAQSGMTGTQFITTRFGNVLGSNGSVVPVFRRQIAEGGPVTVTHRDIIRYFMTIPEACQLVLEAGFMGNGGEIYVFDMGEPVRIYDLAVKMITLAGLKPDIDIPIVFTGLRPGEKLYEELLADEEHTIYTHHPKIKAAQVREHNFKRIRPEVDKLLKATQTETQAQLVRRMKILVPEYISKNSEYCELDKEEIGTT